MSAWVLAGVVLIGAWTQLDEIGWAGWLPLLGTLVLDRFGARHSDAALASVATGAGAARGMRTASARLSSAHARAHGRGEFGFSGDEGYHLSATQGVRAGSFSAGPLLASGARRLCACGDGNAGRTRPRVAMAR